MTDAERALAHLRTETRTPPGQAETWARIQDAAVRDTVEPVVINGRGHGWVAGQVRVFWFSDRSGLTVFAPAVMTMEREVDVFDRFGVSKSAVMRRPEAVAALVRGDYEVAMGEPLAHELIEGWLEVEGELPAIPGLTRRHVAKLLRSHIRAVRLAAARLVARLED